MIKHYQGYPTEWMNEQTTKDNKIIFWKNEMAILTD
jgi:hypothetical protein